MTRKQTLLAAVGFFVFWTLLAVWGGYSIAPRDTCPPESVRVDTVHTVERIVQKVPGPRVEVPMPVPDPVVIRDTVLSYPDVATGRPTEVGVPIRQYRQTYADTTLTAEWEASVAGELLEWDFNYTPIFTTITETETLVVEREVVRVKRQPRLTFGASATGRYFPDSKDFLLTTGPWTNLRIGEKTNLSYSPRFEVFNQTISHTGSLSIRF